MPIYAILDVQNKVTNIIEADIQPPSSLEIDAETAALTMENKFSHFAFRRVGNTIAVDPAIEVAMQAAEDNARGDFTKQLDGVMKKAILVVFDEMNVLRVALGLPEKSLAQFKTDIRNR